MIRRTVARAFGSPGDDRPGPDRAPPPGPRGSRIAVVNGLFNEIAEAFERAAAERAGAGGIGVQATKPCPRTEGLEFTVQSAEGSFRFLNPMDGIAWIYREEEGKFVEDRLLSIQFEGGRPRLIEKPSGAARVPFRFTSVRDLVKELAGAGGAPPAAR